MHNDDNRWQTIFIEYFLYVYGNRQAVDGHGANAMTDRDSNADFLPSKWENIPSEGVPQ